MKKITKKTEEVKVSDWSQKYKIMIAIAFGFWFLFLLVEISHKLDRIIFYLQMIRNSYI